MYRLGLLTILSLLIGCGDDKPSVGGDAVGRAPTVNIVLPLDGEMVPPDQTLTLGATVGDDTTSPEAIEVTIQSDLDGELAHSDSPSSAGDFTTELELSSGTHVLMVIATDEDHQSSADEITLVVNGRPSAPVIAINPSEPALDEDLELEIVAESIDPDGDAVNYEITWTVQNPSMETPSVFIPSEDSTIPSTSTERGALWEVTVTPSDSYGDGEPATISVMVGNGSPSIAEVTIEPEGAQTHNSLSAVVAGFEDPDDDPEALRFEWTLNGDTVAGFTNDSLPSTEHSRGDVITVTVTPYDPFVDGEPLTSEPLTISNTPPSSGSAAIEPDSPLTTDELTLITVGWTDADTDAEAYRYRWFKNGLEDSAAIGSNYPSSNTARGDVVQAELTPDDGFDIGDPIVSPEVTVGNTQPALGTVSLTPSSPTTVDSITATPSGWSDPDGDSEGYSFAWSINGSAAGDATDLLGAHLTTRGDVVQVEVTPFDGIDTGATVLGGPVTIGNSPPTVGSVSITPNPARTGDALSCSWSGFLDADGDSDTSTVEWFIEGSSAGTSTELSAGFSGGDTVTCVVTPHDGSDAGATVSATVVIDNTAPAVTSVTVSPDPALTTDALSCSWSGFSDADGDPDASTARWTINGIPAGTGTSLSSGYIGGDTVTCLVLPSDGTTSGTEVSTSIVIANTIPSIDSVSITSTDTPPKTSSTLTCTWSGFADADGDADVSTVLWMNSGGASLGTGLTLSGAFTGGDIISCTVTPYDGVETGTPLTSPPVSIDNSPPELELAALTPEPAYTDDVLSCAPGITTDPDGDTSFSFTYRWEVGGVLLVSETASTLGSAHFSRGQTVSCEITPHDGSDAGTAVSSNIVTISNSRAVAESVTITPSAVATNDVLTVAITTSDADDEAVFTLIEWKVDGAVVLSGYTATVLSGTAYFDKDQVVTVDVTPEDGTETGATVTAGPIVVDNTPPSAPDVEIDPSAPEPGEDLSCDLVSLSTDIDGDSLTYSTRWYLDGAATTHSSTVLSGTFTEHDDHWECEVTPNDGDDNGTSATDSVVVNDLTNPDPPQFDDETVFSNDDSRTLSGDCEALCDLDITCDDGTGSTLDSATCSSSGTFSVNLDFDRGEVTSCTATCTDVAGNVSGPSEEVVVEVCDPEDIYEDASGSGDSPGGSIGGFITLPDDGLDTVSIVGNIVDGDVDDWYVISAGDDYSEDALAGIDYFNFHAQLSTGGSHYRMEIHKGGSGSGDLECSAGVGYTEYNWFSEDVGDGSHGAPADTRTCSSGSETANLCQDDSDDFYIHVYRLGSSTDSCASYELTIDNGVW